MFSRHVIVSLPNVAFASNTDLGSFVGQVLESKEVWQCTFCIGLALMILGESDCAYNTQLWGY
jgi:hypothetical protein